MPATETKGAEHAAGWARWWLAQFNAQMAEPLGRVVGKLLKQRDQRITALDKRLAELEARPALKYRGIWREDGDYVPGDLATDRGALWHCWSVTRERPGESESWQLMAKMHR